MSHVTESYHKCYTIHESWHISTSHVTYKSDIRSMNESCCTWISHITYDWVMSQMLHYTWVMAHINESCNVCISRMIHERVMLHMNESCHKWLSHVTNATLYVNHVTYAWGMSRMKASFSFFDGYCSTVQCLLDWFEVDLGFTELSVVSRMNASFFTWIICDMTHFLHESYVTWLIHVTYERVIFYMNHMWHDSFARTNESGQTLWISPVKYESIVSCAGWPRLIGCLKLQVIFRQRATNYRALLRKITYKDKASYDSTPPCMNESCVWHTWMS